VFAAATINTIINLYTFRCF